jgi:hypothetical protein
LLCMLKKADLIDFVRQPSKSFLTLCT